MKASTKYNAHGGASWPESTLKFHRDMTCWRYKGIMRNPADYGSAWPPPLAEVRAAAEAWLDEIIRERSLEPDGLTLKRDGGVRFHFDGGVDRVFGVVA